MHQSMDLKDALEKTTALQSKLYQAAKENPKRRFHRLYDKLFREDVLWSAWQQVSRNGGAPGIDGVPIMEIEETGVALYLAQIGQELREQTYKPQAVRCVEIPKSNGKLRRLGIPTVRDRIVQTAAKLVLEPIFEADFRATSYGFRPGLGQPEALAAVNQNARDGFHFVVDADIEGFFDHLDHDRLMEALRRRISDGAVLRLLYRWLKAGMVIGFEWDETDQGTPQGGVISPLLGNIYLHSLDEAFEQPAKGFSGRIVRYADDLLIQCGKLVAAERALDWLRRMVTSLGLRLSDAKTSIVEDAQEGFDFLGFHHRRISLRGHPQQPVYNVRWPSRRACQKFRDHIKEILVRTGYVENAQDWNALTQDLNRYIQGWGGYFRTRQGSRVLGSLDEYVQQRVARYLARSQPKGKKRKRRNWTHYAAWLKERNSLLRLSRPKDWHPNAYRGKANIRWKAV